MTPRPASALTLALLLSTAAALSAQRGPADTARVPASGSTIVSEIKPSESEQADVFYVENRSTQDIIVINIQLLECENIREPCHPVKLKVRIKAGDKRMIYRIHPGNPDQPSHYSINFHWEPET